MVTTQVQQTRQDVWREMVENGVSRSEIAREFNVPYGSVYAATKDLALGLPNTSRARIYVNGKPRNDVIREMAKTGQYNRRQIARELGVDYSVVWAATQKMHELDVKKSAASNSLGKYLNENGEGEDEEQEEDFAFNDDEEEDDE